MATRLIFLGLVLSSLSWAAEIERLMLFGGNGYPANSIPLFCKWAVKEKEQEKEKEKSHLLLIHWASGNPEKNNYYVSPFKGCIDSIETAADETTVGEHLEELKEQIEWATAIFFTGGNQNRIMDILEKYPQLANQMRERYKKGVLFGGTSAGTAIMSSTMITGEGTFTKEGDYDLFDELDPAAVETKPGLGLLSLAVVDQHFFKKVRANRLLSTLLKGNDKMGIGIDEGAAISIEGNRALEVLGGIAIAFYYEKTPKDGSYRVPEPGDRFDLIDKTRLP